MTNEIRSAVSSIINFFPRELLFRARRAYRAGRAVDITVCESHLRYLGHSRSAIAAAEEHVITCARLPRE